VVILGLVRLTALDLVAAIFALLGACALAVSTVCFVDTKDLAGLYVLVLGASALAASLKLARAR
jgi:hypothetical protein